MKPELINKLFDLQESINELNQQINAELNHGQEITAQNKQEFIDFFDPKITAVTTRYQKLKAELQHIL